MSFCLQFSTDASLTDKKCTSFSKIYLESRFAVETNVPFFQELNPEGERCENNMNFNDVDDNIYTDDRIVRLYHTNRAGQVISKILSQR